MPLVRPANPDDLPRVGTTLAAAFANDPVWWWMASPGVRWPDRAEVSKEMAVPGGPPMWLMWRKPKGSAGR